MTCRINFWPLSNFVGASLEVTRTISNNKLHFTRECSILLKREKGPGTGFPFLFSFLMILTFFKNILILIITSLGIHYSQNVFVVFYLSVHRGTGVFLVVFFFLLLLSHTRPALVLASRLPPFYRKTLKNCACSADPGFLNETEGSLFFLSCLSSYTNGW